MAGILPSGDMGSKSLPALSPPSSLSSPAGLGDRELSPQAKVRDGLEPIIMSLDLLNDSVDTIVSEVADSGTDKLTIGDLEKLFQQYFSKQAFADSVTLAFTRPSPPAIEQSLMVRQQVKSNDVIKKQPASKFEDVFSKQSSSSGSKSSRSGGGFEAGYNTVMGGAYAATHDPMRFLDTAIPSLLGKIFKGKDNADKSSSKSKKKESFYGDSDVEDGAFFGNFANQASRTVGSTIEGVSYGRDGDSNQSINTITGGLGVDDAKRPLGTAADPLYFLDTGGSASVVTSSVDDLQEESAKVGMKADKVLEHTLENPDQSAFGNFIGGGDGGGGKRGQKVAGGGDKGAGIGTVLIVGMILAALIIFKDVVEKVFDKVIIPLGEVLVDFLRALKDPLINLITAVIDVVVVVLGVIKDILIAIAPYLVDMAVAICQVLVVVLGVVRDILVAIAPYLIEIAKAICGVVVVALEIVIGILTALKEPIIKIAEVFGGILVTIANAILNLVKIITFPLQLVAKILETIQPHILRIADFIGGTIAEWFEENGGTIKALATSVANIAQTIADKIGEFFKGINAEAIGKAVGGAVTAGLGFLERVFSGLNAALDGIVAIFRSLRNSKLGSVLGWDDDSRARKEEERAEKRRETLASNAPEAKEGFLNLRNVLLSEEHGSESQIKLLQGIYKDTTLLANLVFEGNKQFAESIEARSVDDLIITSNGQVFETAPDDSILAIKNGQVSLSPSSPFSSVSHQASSSYGTGGRSGSSSSTVTNVYNESSVIDSAGISPFSEFCPVGFP